MAKRKVEKKETSFHNLPALREDVRQLPVSAPAIVSYGSQNLPTMSIPVEDLPPEFKGAQVETIDPGFPPTIKWTAPGNVCMGVYKGLSAKTGPNESMLYHFDYKGQRFSVWGTTVLDRMFADHDIAKGDYVCIGYVGDIESDRNPCKMFALKVMKPTRKSPEIVSE